MNIPLTEEQKKAVFAGPFVSVTAAAGSGKTRVIVARIAYLISEGADPDSIVAITFTRKAAAEIVQRLRDAGIRVGFCGTVHSYFLKLINLDRGEQAQISVIPPDMFKHQVEQQLKSVDAKESFDKAMETFGDLKHSLSTTAIRYVRRVNESNNLIDYDQILQIASNPQFLVEHAFSTMHLLVDEFQDTGVLERAFYEAVQPASMMIVSDHRQTLYAFRGADPESPKRMAEKKGMEQVVLTENWRCSEEIQKTAERNLNGVVAMAGWDLSVIAQEISETMPDAVLCGTNRTVNLVTEELLKRGIAVVGGVNLTERQKQMEAMFRSLAAPDNEFLYENLLRCINPALLASTKRLAEKMLTSTNQVPIPPNDPSFWNLRNEAEMFKDAYPDMTISELAEFVVEPTADPEAAAGMVCCTVHAAKGLEWRSVLFVDDIGDSEAHNRIRYVACTRAREELKVMRLWKEWN